MFDRDEKLNEPVTLNPLNLGEYHLPKVPVVTLENGATCTPQHYFGFDHSLDSVEALLDNIEFSADYPVFVSTDQGGLFLQVGVVGIDNYDRNRNNKPRKLVYGRKWRVEPNLPTSEIIQTVFLAIKKAREHELRELFTLVDVFTHKVSTPFNCHQDLPLMATHSDLFKDAFSPQFNIASVQTLLASLNVGGRAIHLSGFQKRPNNYLLDVTLSKTTGTDHQENGFSELEGAQLTLVLNHGSLNELLYQLMDEMLKLSDRFVEEHFLYKGFARFSRQQDVVSLARFSVNTRYISATQFDERGQEALRVHNCLVDETRVPVIFNEAQKRRLLAVLK